MPRQTSVHGRIPGTTPEWDRTACGWQIRHMIADITDDPRQVTCRRCLLSTTRMFQVGRVDTEAPDA